MDMVNINLKCLTIICLCFIGVHSESQEPLIWPATYVDDGNPMIEFTCGAYLKAGESLTWYRKEGPKSELKITTGIEQKYDGYRTLQLIWPLAILPSGSNVYCLKRFPVMKSGTTTWSTTRKDINPIIFQKDRIAPLTDDEGPWLTPETFVDDGGSVIEFTCWAYLYEGDILSWFQIQESDNRVRLTMVQQETLYGYMKIKLRKTLEPSDNGTQIYCIREKKIYEKNDKYKESQRTLIKFHREIKHFETYVTVEPSADIVFFEEGDELEFVCGGSEPAAGRALTWYLQGPGFRQHLPPLQSYHKSTNKNHLTLPVEIAHHHSILYCAQVFTFKFMNGSITSYGERTRSHMITLLHRGQSEPREHPRVAPEKFVDNGRPFLQFTCYMFLKPRQILLWYQSKGSTDADDILLRFVQLQDPKAEEGEWVVLTLNKTLEPEDNGSEIYCAKQTVRPDGSFSNVLNVSERIPLTLRRYIPPLVNAFVTVEPNNTDILFDVNTTLRLTCSGSKPVDGRNYTWLKKDSKSRLAVLEGQKYDQTTNLNVLEMSLNEAHHLNQLVCALGFLSYIRLNDGSLRCKIYGEPTEPKTITLIRRESSAEKQLTSHTIPAEKQMTSHTIPQADRVFTAETYGTLAVAILLAVTALVTSAVACCVLRRIRSAPATPPAPPAPTATVADYEQYANVPREMASPQVTYAVLDLPQPARRTARAPAPETALYAEICKR